MSRLSRLGLRARLAIALAGVAVLAVALSLVLSDIGLQNEIDRSNRDRLQASAGHLAQVAAELYEREGRFTEDARSELKHLAEIDGLRASVDGPTEGSPRASATVRAGGRSVAVLWVEPTDRAEFEQPLEGLHHRLGRIHAIAAVLAGALGLIAAMLVAVPLSRPLRRLTDGARRMQAGQLDVRVEPSGGGELAELAIALNRLAATLQQAENLRQEATADLAHELRTPLSGIIGRIEAAQDGVMADATANLEAMHAEALRLRSLIDDLGALGEAQRPGLLIEHAPVDLAELVRERVELRRRAFEARGVAVAFEGRAAVVAGDPVRLGQIVDNLLSNAARYTDRGGSTHVRVGTRNGEAVLEIQDTGVGIAPDELPHVFERFWRSEKSRSRDRGGAGIGLAIVQALVAAHDGHIEVASSPSRGSTFTVMLPLATDQRMRSKPRSRPSVEQNS